MGLKVIQMDVKSLRNMDVKNKKSVYRVPIKLASCQTIEKEASQRDIIGKGSSETRVPDGYKRNMKIHVKIKRQEGEPAKERRKFVTKIEEIMIQETKEDIIEEKCESCKIVQSAETQDTKDRIVPIQIMLNNTQDEKEYEVSKKISIDKKKAFHIKEHFEEKEETANGKVIRKESPIINSVEVNDGKTATIGIGKMKTSYSNHIGDEKGSNTTNGKDERNNTDFDQKVSMLDKTPVNYQLVVSVSRRKSFANFNFSG